jgi:1-acyl-sn-glycerol-3-phosphate acyltransferase
LLGLTLLWLSQSVRRLAELALWQFLPVRAEQQLRQFEPGRVLAPTFAGTGGGVWPLVVAVVLAPFAGALSDTWPRRWVVVGSAAFCVAVFAGVGMALHDWWACWFFLLLGFAVYRPAQTAMLPAAARDTRVPLPRVNSWMQAGLSLALIAFLIPGGLFFHVVLSTALGREQDAERATWLLLGLMAWVLVGALPAWFPSDAPRTGKPSLALAGFFRDARRVVADAEARACLLLLAGARVFVFMLMSFLAAVAAAALADQQGELHLGQLAVLPCWIAGGQVVGALLAGVQGHPRRSLGLAPLALLGVWLALLVGAPGGAWLPYCGVVGFLLGLLLVPLEAGYQEALPADARGNGMAFSFALDALFTMVAIFLLREGPRYGLTTSLWLILLLLAALTFFAGWCFFRETLEQLFEFPVWFLYRIRARGPGKDAVPHHGPLLVVANHSTYTDPFFLGKVLPRRLTPMMTSVFYDMPGIRWMMRHVARAIRVPAGQFRREAPELKEAITVLDGGGCVVIFPEGSLRKKEQPILRMFGQGVWHILSERPQTPVLVCWIEGGWGSFLSYFNGKPGRNKRLDFRRPIDVVIDEPAPLKPAVLKEHRTTRTHLMERCLKLRSVLGLSTTQEAPGEAEDD